MDSTFSTLYTRNTAMEIGFELEEVEMSPCFLIGVIWGATGGTAFRTIKFGTWNKIYPDIELFRIW